MKLGVTHKLGLALSGFALLTIVGCILLYGMLGRFQSGLGSILDVARPMDAAAYEMEVNTLELGMAVRRFLHQPDPLRRAALEDAVRDFNQYQAIYQNIATNQRQRDLAQKVDEIFSNYAKLGRDLIDHKMVYFARRDAVFGLLDRLEEVTKEIARSTDPKITGPSDNNLRQMQFFAVLWAEIAEALSTMSKMETDTNPIEHKFEQEFAMIGAMLQDYSNHWPQTNKPEWLNRMTSDFAQASVLAQQLAQTSATLGQDLLIFAEYGKQLNNILDDQIQVETETSLQALYNELKSMVLLGYQMLVSWAPIMTLMIGAILIYVSHLVVRPVRQLSAAANIISEGDLGYRVQATQKDELGLLGRTFNMMAERLQAAYDRANRTNLELEAKVTERTHALAVVNDRLNNELTLRKQTEIELREALAAANAASHAKTLFLGNMSHELRTPLNAIIGFSEVIKGELFGPVANEKYLDYANDINQSGAHLLRLINELLDISRIEAGELTLSDDTVDIAACIGESLHMLQEQANSRRVLLSSDIARDMPLMRGYQTRIKQVIINLAGNAIKFTPPDGAVKVSAGMSPQGDIQIKIMDTGIGIPREDLAKVLEPFGQVSNDLTRAHEGAGLGLPLAKLLTERHDGVLTINSSLGHGTTVKIIFPRSRTVSGLPPAELRLIG